jgi:hypothetical protein
MIPENPIPPKEQALVLLVREIGHLRRSLTIAFGLGVIALIIALTWRGPAETPPHEALIRDRTHAEAAVADALSRLLRKHAVDKADVEPIAGEAAKQLLDAMQHDTSGATARRFAA